MKRVLIVLAALLTLCIAVSVALADDVWGNNVVQAGSNSVTRAYLYGNASSTNLALKIRGSADAVSVSFNIHTALADDDWRTDGGREYLRIQGMYKVPQAVLDDLRITQYAMQFRNDDRGEWLYGDRGFELRPLSGNSGGPKFSEISSGTRYEKLMYDDNRGFYQEVKFTWYDDAGQPTAGVSPTVFTTQISLGYLPVEVPEGRLIPASATGATPAVSNGRVNYTLTNEFAVNNTLTTQIIPPDGASVQQCAVYTDAECSNYAPGFSPIGDNQGITVFENASETRIVDHVYYIRWGTNEGYITEKLNIAVIPPSESSSTEVVKLYGDAVTLMGVSGFNFSKGLQRDVDISDGAHPGDPAESRTVAPFLNIITYDITDAETWYRLFMGSPSAQEALISQRFALPADTTEYVFVGTNINASDEYVKSALDNYDVRRTPPTDNVGKYVENLEAVASVSTDGYDLLFTPLGFRQTLCIKWWDVYGRVHYARADVQICPQNDMEIGKTYKYSNSLMDELRVRAFSEPVSDTAYADGTILYSLSNSGGYSNGIDLKAELTRPNDSSVVALRCNGNGPIALDADGKAIIQSRLRAEDCTTPRIGSWRLEWLDAGDQVVASEVLFWQTNTVNENYWMKQRFSPAPRSRTLVLGISTRNRGLFSYNAADGEWAFEIPLGTDPTSLNLEELTRRGLDAVGIKPPAGAVSCRMDFWEMGLYGNDPGIVERSMATQQLTQVSGFSGGAARQHSGQYVSKTTLEGTDITLYSVQDTPVTNSNMMFVQWYSDAAGTRPITLESGKTIEYIMLTLLPYEAQMDTPAVDEGDASAMAAAARRGWPFATVEGMSGIYYLRCKDLIATGISAASNQRYQLRDLELVDRFGNAVTLPAGSRVTIYWPYPSGVTYVNDQQKMQRLYNITVEHYVGAGALTQESVQLTFTPYGASYTVTTFSPFLLKYSAARRPGVPGIPAVDPLSPAIPVTGGGSLAGYALLALAAALAVPVLTGKRRKN